MCNHNCPGRKCSRFAHCFRDFYAGQGERPYAVAMKRHGPALHCYQPLNEVTAPIELKVEHGILQGYVLAFSPGHAEALACTTRQYLVATGQWDPPKAIEPVSKALTELTQRSYYKYELGILCLAYHDINGQVEDPHRPHLVNITPGHYHKPTYVCPICLKFLMGDERGS